MMSALTIHKGLTINHHVCSSIITTIHIAVQAAEQLVDLVICQRKTKE